MASGNSGNQKANHLSSKGKQSDGSIHTNSHMDNLMDENLYNKLSNEQDRKTNPIDDIPIPVSKPKTFEELLAQEISKGNAGGIIAE